MRKAVVALILVVALVAAALTGIGAILFSEPESDPAGPERTIQPGAQEAPRRGLAPFYSQSLDWKACGTNQCTRLQVPLDYSAPSGRTISLAVLRVPARSRAGYLGPMVVNPGGPGAPGTSYAQQAPLLFGAAIREHYDVVGFDPRGTGDSEPVDCLSDDKLDAYLAEDPAPDDPQEVQAAVSAARGFAQGCRERSGDLLDHISTEDSARDLDVLRAALGRDRLDYFGASYGTKLGAVYATLFPEQAGRMVLDGAMDPEMSSRELSLGQAGGFETALHAYAASCADDSGCTLGDSPDQVVGSIRQLVAGIDAEPLPASGRKLTVGNAFYGIVLPLYNEDYWPLLTQALESAEKGDGTSLMSLSDTYASRSPSGYVDNSIEANLAINCTDDPWALTPAQVPDEYPAFDEVSPTFGKAFAWGLVGCLGFQEAGAEGHPVAIDGAGAAPILVIGTTRDPATPMAWAEKLAKQLKSAVLIRRDGDGHTGYYSGNACVDDAVENYLVAGTIPDDPISC